MLGWFIAFLFYFLINNQPEVRAGWCFWLLKEAWQKSLRSALPACCTIFFFFCLANLSSDDQCLSWLIRGRAALVYLSGKWILVIASVV